MKGLVWGYTFKDGCKKMDEIKENYLKYQYNIVKEYKSEIRYEIEFDNGDIWRVIRASENSRGYKANLSYVDIRIDGDFVDMIILPCTCIGPWNAIKYFKMNTMEGD